LGQLSPSVDRQPGSTAAPKPRCLDRIPLERRSIKRNLIRVAIAATVTGLLVWLPTAAQAGVAFNGID
jgi:hypothetical protein